MNNLKKQLTELTELIDIIAALDKYGSRPTAKDNYINHKLRLQHSFCKEAQILSTEIARRIEEQSANIATQLQALEPKNTTPTQETPIAAKQKTVIDKPIQTIKEEINPPQSAATEEPQPTYVTNTPTAMRETPKTDTTAHNEHKSEVQTEYIVEQQVKQTVFVAEQPRNPQNKSPELFDRVITGEVRQTDTIRQTVKETNADRPRPKDLNHLIGIGDRFRFSRELFGGNGEKMSKTLNEINNMATLQEATDYITVILGWDKDNHTVQDFIAVLKRRF